MTFSFRATGRGGPGFRRLQTSAETDSRSAGSQSASLPPRARSPPHKEPRFPLRDSSPRPRDRPEERVQQPSDEKREGDDEGRNRGRGLPPALFHDHEEVRNARDEESDRYHRDDDLDRVQSSGTRETEETGRAEVAAEEPDDERLRGLARQTEPAGDKGPGEALDDAEQVKAVGEKEEERPEDK